MSGKIGRNDPCPCGSGRKYKQCHLGAPDDRWAREVAQEADPETADAPRRRTWTRYVPLVIAAVGGVTAAVLAATRGSAEAIPVVGATGLVAIGWYLFSDPPPPRNDSGDPAGLNFGR